MSECRHWYKTPDNEKYRIAFMPNGIDCCIDCYERVDLSVLDMFLSANHEQWEKDYAQANWLIAEKDAEIDALRDAIEILESAELEKPR